MKRSVPYRDEVERQKANSKEHSKCETSNQKTNGNGLSHLARFEGDRWANQITFWLLRKNKRRTGKQKTR